jgi:hypothetical protein
MLNLNTLLKLLLVVVFVLFFSIIGVNKKTIDSLNNFNELKDNVETLRGVLWANFTFIFVSIAIALTFIVAKRMTQRYKMTVAFCGFFLLLLIGLTIYEEIILRDFETSDKKKFDNIYIISSVLNIMFLVMFVGLIKIVDQSYVNADEIPPEMMDEYLRDMHTRPPVEYEYSDSGDYNVEYNQENNKNNGTSGYNGDYFDTGFDDDEFTGPVQMGQTYNSVYGASKYRVRPSNRYTGENDLDEQFYTTREY